MSLRIEKSNPSVTIQDQGRIGFQRYGVSPSGPMDWFSHAIANHLLGNEAGAAALEIGPLGATVKAESDIRIAIASPIEARTVTLAQGELLPLIPSGCNYLYVALPGGIAGNQVMGSQAMHRRSGLGGSHVEPGQLLHANKLEQARGPDLRLPALPKAPQRLRVIEGPQASHLNEESRALLYGTDWTVSARSDRMGLRLEGPALSLPHGADIVSDGIATGAIQVPGDGHPILLMADRQTTGGYPKPAVMIRADLPCAAQLPIGSTLRFTPCSTAQAHEALKSLNNFLQTIPKNAKAIGNVALTSADLLALNLIDGAFNAQNGY